MHTRGNQRIWKFFGQHRVASIAAAHLVVVGMLAAVLLSGAFGTTLFGAFAQAPSSSGDQTYVVMSGDTLGAIAGRYHTTWQSLASYNRIANPNMIYINEHVCVPGQKPGGGTGTTTYIPPTGTKGASNVFPYGQCTWWASQRYFQLHGVFVPWTTNSNAWQWVARANDFRWHVSSWPSAGAIVVIQPWTQGAYGLGHVAVVERILGNGHVLASNMNWNPYPGSVLNVEFAPGPGITFVTL